MRRFTRPGSILGLTAILGFVLTTSVLAMFTVTAIAITPQKRLEQLLPANTVMFVTVNSGLSGTSAGQAFDIDSLTAGPISTEIAGLISGSRMRRTTCLHAVGEAAAQFPELGPGTAFVLLPPSYRASERLLANGSRQHVLNAVARNTVVVAPLDVQMTPFDLLSGRQAPSGSSVATVYRRTRVYRQAFGDCRASIGGARGYYAATVQGYLVLGLRLAVVEAVIDTAAGAGSSLETAPGLSPFTRPPSSAAGTFYLSFHQLAERTPGLSSLLATGQPRSRSTAKAVPRQGRLSGYLYRTASGVVAQARQPWPEGLRRSWLNGFLRLEHY